MMKKSLFEAKIKQLETILQDKEQGWIDSSLAEMEAERGQRS